MMMTMQGWNSNFVLLTAYYKSFRHKSFAKIQNLLLNYEAVRVLHRHRKYPGSIRAGEEEEMTVTVVVVPQTMWCIVDVRCTTEKLTREIYLVQESEHLSFRASSKNDKKHWLPRLLDTQHKYTALVRHYSDTIPSYRRRNFSSWSRAFQLRIFAINYKLQHNNFCWCTYVDLKYF